MKKPWLATAALGAGASAVWLLTRARRRGAAERERATRYNSRASGCHYSARLWSGFDFARAWVDPGPSPLGNPGPYLKVPWCHPDDSPTVGEVEQRVYPLSLKRGVRRGIRRDEDGTLWWVPIEEHDAEWWQEYKQREFARLFGARITRAAAGSRDTAA